MSEGERKVRKFSTVTLLVGALVTIISTIMLNTSSWAVTQLTAVEPMEKTMITILEEGRTHQREAIVFRKESRKERKELMALVTDGRARLLSVEKRCDENRKDIQECENRHYFFKIKD